MRQPHAFIIASRGCAPQRFRLVTSEPAPGKWAYELLLRGSVVGGSVETFDSQDDAITAGQLVAKMAAHGTL